MATEQRVAGGRATIAQRGGTSQPAPEVPSGAAAPSPRRRKRLLALVLGVVLVAGGGAGYWFFVGPGGATGDTTAQEAPPHTEPGVVQPVEAVSINLAGGRYLRLGFALQLAAEVEEELDPSKAIDQAISLFSGRPVEEVGSAEGRAALKAALADQLQEAYHGEVLEVYFTEYVTQ